MSSWAGLEYLYVPTCKGLRIAAVRHLKNAGGPAGLGPWVRGRKWCHAVHCCPLLFVWQPHCTAGLPTGWELMGLALHTLFPRPHWSAHNYDSQCLVRGSPGVLEGDPGIPSRMKRILCWLFGSQYWGGGCNLQFLIIYGREFSSDETNIKLSHYFYIS